MSEPRQNEPTGSATRPEPKRRLSAEEARQGEIVLRRPWQRWVFTIGLILIVLFFVLIGILWR